MKRIRSKKSECLLCGNVGNLFYEDKHRIYHSCDFCKGIYIPFNFLPDKKTEIDRYRTHNNDVEDPRYQKFVSPIVNAVVKDFVAGKSSGLDFGAGTGPVITKLLREKGFDIAPYDPFFHDKPELLEKQYDFIVCCEVMEHFHNPHEEFQRLKSLLRPNGKIYCMTHLFSDDIHFDTWYYKNDPTHVFIYRPETLHFIKREMNFSAVQNVGKLIIFKS